MPFRQTLACSRQEYDNESTINYTICFPMRNTIAAPFSQQHSNLYFIIKKRGTESSTTKN